MPIFQILYLRENVLVRSEDVDVRDLLDAIDKASDKAPDLTAEIRCDGVRVGLIGPSLDENALRSAELAAEDNERSPECEIAEEMRSRLSLAR
jgi:hypothetical protein